MTRSYSPAESIERFAQVSAALDHGCAARAVVLCAAGVGEETWSAVERHWIYQLGSNDGAALAHRFGASYSASLDALLPPRPTASFDSAEPTTQRSPSEESDPTFREVPAYAVEDPADLTLQIPAFRRDADVTLVQASALARPRSTILPPPPWSERFAEQTLDLAAFPYSLASASPFVSSGGRRPLLHRFDPYSGVPLPVPVWIS